MQDSNYNRILDIYIHDVDNNDNLSMLYEWQGILLKKTQDLKVRIKNKNIELQSSYNLKTKDELILMTDLNTNVQYFLRHIHNRIKRLKTFKKNNQNIYFNMLKFFKEIVKEKISSDEYEKIKAEAYSKAEALLAQENENT